VFSAGECGRHGWLLVDGPLGRGRELPLCAFPACDGGSDLAGTSHQPTPGGTLLSAVRPLGSHPDCDDAPHSVGRVMCRRWRRWQAATSAKTAESENCPGRLLYNRNSMNNAPGMKGTPGVRSLYG